MSKFNPLPLQIAFWGPPGSGKTCLKNIMLDSLLRSYQHQILNFFVEKDVEQEKVRDSNLPDQEYWTFWNVGRKVKSDVDPNNKEGINVSSRSHRLEIFDPAGERAFRSNNHPSPYEKAELVILVLDPTQSPFYKKDPSFSIEQYSYPFPKHDKMDSVDLSEFVDQSIFFQGNFTVGHKAEEDPAHEEISDYIDRVRALLGTRRNPEGLVAVCITKMDLIPISDRELEPKVFLRQYFGEGMEHALNQKPSLDVSFYFISKSDDIFTLPPSKNKNLHIKSLVIQVLKLLEARERKQIEEQSFFTSKKYNQKIYIPYLQNGFV